MESIIFHQDPYNMVSLLKNCDFICGMFRNSFLTPWTRLCSLFKLSSTLFGMLVFLIFVECTLQQTKSWNAMSGGSTNPFPKQRTLKRLTFQVDGFTLKPDQMQVFNPLLILCLIPVFETVVYPLVKKIGLPTGWVFTKFWFFPWSQCQRCIVWMTNEHFLGDPRLSSL